MERLIINTPDTTLQAFSSHTLTSGKTGSGKSSSSSFILENFYLFKKYKCIDFDTSGRFENCSYSLPEDDPELIYEMNEHPDLVKNWSLRPMGFKDNVYMICGRGLHSIPKLPKNIKLVSFREEDLTWEFILILLGDSPALLPTLNELQAKFGNDTTMKDIKEIVFNRKFRGNPTHFKFSPPAMESMIKNRLVSWTQTGMFNEKVERIDFEKELNDNETITCVNTVLLESGEEEEIAYAIWLDKIIKLARRRKLDHRVMIFAKEVHDYMSWTLCRKQILQILRKGRVLGKKGIDLLSDTQRSKDLKPIMRRQFGYYHQMKGDFNDAETLLEIQFIPKDYLYKIPRFGVGQSMILTGGRWDQPVVMPPCRHKHISPKCDVLRLLGEIYGYAEYDPEELLKIDKMFTQVPEVEKSATGEDEGTGL